MKNKFLDNLDSGWGDVIGNTYEDASEKVLLHFKNDSNDDATIYFKNPKSINFSDFKIAWTIKGNIFVSFVLYVNDNDNLKISTHITKPICNVKLNFNFYLRDILKTDRDSEYDVLISYNEHDSEYKSCEMYLDLKYNNYCKEIQEILDSLNVLILNDKKFDKGNNPNVLKNTSEMYLELLEKIKE